MGAIRLPIPIFSEKIFEEVTIRRLVAGVLADTHRIVEKGDIYKAIQTFVAGGIESIGDITDRPSINSLVGKMPFKSAYYLATKIIFLDEKDDGVEGYYPCPRCNEPKICEAGEDRDTRDFISDLKINYMEGKDNLFTVELDNPVEIKDESGGEEGILKLALHYPTLNDCSAAFNRAGDKDKGRLQFQIYVQALEQVNDNEVDRKYKNSLGMFIFEKMDRKDIRKISDKCEEFGMKTEATKICNKCQKEFVVEINTANFFGSALR
jgi:hypothetical protein